METLLGSIILMLFILFTIDLSQTATAMHKINYFTKMCARSASLSTGKRVDFIKKNSKRKLSLALLNEILALRINSIKVNLLGKKGNLLPDEAVIRSGAVLTLQVDANIWMNFVPFSIFKLPGTKVMTERTFLPGGRFHHKTGVTFIVE